ncbi:hypothetical protein TNCV_2731861 [Trichonephila clavipes]|nr:hypothetical protein TNCV_2731861 [Trichonephila clavipes]
MNICLESPLSDYDDPSVCFLTSTEAANSSNQGHGLKCRKFETSAAQDPTWKGNQCRLKMFRLKRPPVGVMRKLGQAGAVFVAWLWFKITRSVANIPRAVLKYDVKK